MNNAKKVLITDNGAHSRNEQRIAYHRKYTGSVLIKKIQVNEFGKLIIK